MTKNSNSRFFYGYIIVIASFFLLLVMHGMYSTYGIFFNPIQEQFSWSRTTISGANSLAFFLMGVSSIATGRLTDRFGPRIVVAILGFLLGLGYLLMSQVNSVWQLYLFYGALVGIGTSIGDVALLSTTARWFTRRRGMMTGIVKVGTGTGMFIMPVVVSWLIASYDWRNTYIILGIIAIVSIVVIAQFLRRDPGQKGLKPYGEPESDASSSDLADTGYSLREAMRTGQFWMVCAIYFLIWYCALTMTTHVVPHAIDLDVSVARAAGIMSVIGGVSIMGRLVMGTTSDRTGNRRALMITYLVFVASFLWLQLAQELWALYIFAVIYGFAHGGFFALVSPLIAELFGTKSHGVIFGMILFIGQIGGALGPVIAGYIFDNTESYQLAFIILIAASVIGLILSILLRPTPIKEKQAAPY